MYVIPSPSVAEQGQYALGYAIGLYVQNNTLKLMFGAGWENYGLHIVVGYVD